MRQRQAGADADLENPLSRPIVGDAHGRLAPGVKHRAEDNVVRAGEQAIGADRVLQVHRVAFVIVNGPARPTPRRVR